MVELFAAVGANVSVAELADSIFAARCGEVYNVLSHVLQKFIH